MNKESTVVEIATISEENYTPMLFEVEESITYECIKSTVFEAFRDTYRKIADRWKEPNVETVILSQEFTEELEKRGFKRIRGRINLTFWGWNKINRFWEDNSGDIDVELWELLKGELADDQTVAGGGGSGDGVEDREKRVD